MRIGWVLLGVLVIAACGSSSDDDRVARGGEGAVCTDGHNCASGLLCFVQGADSIVGVCTKPPAACAGKVGCDCLDELQAGCATGWSCEGIMGNYLAACGQGSTLLEEGEACSPVRDCEAGLFCHVPTPGKPGACKKLPEACAADPSCDCLESLKGTCSGGWHCSIWGERATVACN